MLKKKGKLLVLYMAWLPFEDKIAPDAFEVLHYAALAILRPKFT